MGVEEGFRSFAASAIVIVDGEAWMSSRDGAVTRMAGGCGEEPDESEDSVMVGGGRSFSLAEGNKLTL